MENKILHENLRILHKTTNSSLESVPWNVEDECYHHIVCQNGSGTLRVTKDDKTVHLHSTYSPEKESEEFIAPLVSQKDEFIVLFGVGYFYHAKEIIRKTGAESTIILIEPDEYVVRAAMQNVSLQPIFVNENVKLVVSTQGEAYVKNFQQWMDWINVDRVSMIVAPAYATLYKIPLQRCCEALEEVYTTNKLKQNTILAYANQWGRNLIVNLKDTLNSYTIELFQEKIKNMPIVIVSAGPSLNKNVHLLQKIKGKALIICVYTAYKVLVQHQIEPDFVMTIEANQLIHETEAEKLEALTVPLIYTPYTEPQLLKKHTGYPFVMPTINDTVFIRWMQSFEKPISLLLNGGSVTTTALGFAVRFGCKPIILIGLDLAYSENRSHAKGTYYDGKNVFESLGEQKTYVEDIDGKPIPTDLVLNSYRVWIEGLIEKSDTLFLDCTEGGAKIKGTSILSLEAAMDQYLQIDYSEQIHQLTHPNKDAKLFSKAEVQKIYDQLVSSMQGFRQMQTYLKGNMIASRGLEKIYRNMVYKDNEKALSFLQTIRQNDEKIDQFKNDFELLDYYFQKAFFESRQLPQETEEGLNVATKSIAFYEGLQNSIDALLPVLENAIDDIGKELIQDGNE